MFSFFLVSLFVSLVNFGLMVLRHILSLVKQALDSIPDLLYAAPSFSLNCHADELVSLLTPSFPSNKYRHRVVKFIAAHIRKSLGATSLCLGSFAERTYLPDQPVAMSCFLCRGQESSWFIRVNEALCKVFHKT
jgi:hypothetical protein